MGKKPTFRDLTGQRFGRLVVLKESHKDRHHGYHWHVRCDCGTIKTTTGTGLKAGKINSCGCLFREKLFSRITKHGGTHTPEHRTWEAMKWRCLNPRNAAYKHYGGRGITICKRWHKFENFLEDMGKKPSAKHSLDRIDNNGNYEPGNCRWVTQAVQTRNTRRAIRLEVENIEMTLGVACRRYGISYTNISHKVRKSDYSHQEAFNEFVLRHGARPILN